MAKMNWAAAKQRDLVASAVRVSRQYEFTPPAKKKRIRDSIPEWTPEPVKPGVGVSFVRIGSDVIDVGLSNSVDDADFVAPDMSAALRMIDELRFDARLQH